jgi:hypothetical protein
VGQGVCERWYRVVALRIYKVWAQAIVAAKDGAPGKKKKNVASEERVAA